MEDEINETVDDAQHEADAADETTTDTTDTGGDAEHGEDTQDDGTAADSKVYPESVVKKLRAENARLRTGNKAALAEAEERGRESFARDAGRALGFIESEEDVAPEQLLAAAREREEAANQQSAAAAQKLKNYQIKDAVNEAAAAHSGNAKLILPFLKGSDQLADLDPGSEDFADQVEALVEDAIAKNPQLKVAPAAARRSGGDMSGGNNESKKGELSVDEIREQRRARRKQSLGLR